MAPLTIHILKNMSLTQHTSSIRVQAHIIDYNITVIIVKVKSVSRIAKNNEKTAVLYVLLVHIHDGLLFPQHVRILHKKPCEY